jgi:threonine dehydratase
MTSWSEIEQAHHALTGLVKHTPLVRSRTFSEMAGCNLFLKLENLQTTTVNHPRSPSDTFG